LLLNLDETSVKFFYEPARGLRIGKKAAQNLRAPIKRNTSKGQQRRALSYIAIICDDPALQCDLPQIMLVASAILPTGAYNAVKDHLAGNVHIWRRKSGWINNEVFAEILTLLGGVLKKIAPSRQPILMMDAHKVHFASPVLRCAEKHNIFTMIVPASCTHLFQVLDTDVFARFKLFFRRRLQERMVVGRNEDLSSLAIVEEINAAIVSVINGLDWSPAFRKNGFGQDGFARRSLLEALQWDEYPVLPGTIPSYEAFREIFPQRSVIPFDMLLRPTIGLSPRQRFPGQMAAPEETELGPPEVEPWIRRLRPRRAGANLGLSASHAPTESSSPAASCPPPLPPPLAPPPSGTNQPRMLVLRAKLPPEPHRPTRD
jgi:hypothetical protein